MKLSVINKYEKKQSERSTKQKKELKNYTITLKYDTETEDDKGNGRLRRAAGATYRTEK